jgi:TonB family protein
MKLCVFLLLTALSWAQSNGEPAQNSSAPNQPAAVLVKLFPLTYPPLARQARIMGDVMVQLKILKDGTVESAEIVSGPAMLKQAALDSAQKSTYECQNCGDSVTTYLLTYTFGFREDGPDCSVKRLRSAKCLGLWRCGRWQNAPTRSPVIGQSPGHVVILADATCVETESSR